MSNMNAPAIKFEDGQAYERYMGVWSQLAGREFLQWLAPKQGERWLDVGCGNAAFTALLAETCKPAHVWGVDPSAAQIAYAQARELSCLAEFKLGDAMALPFEADQFDVAVMPLVIFFVPDPAKGVAEMARVVRPGGTVCAYGWDLLADGIPYEPLAAELRAMGQVVPLPPSPGAAALSSLEGLWSEAGLVDIQTRVIEVQRTYESFDEYWSIVLGGPAVSAILKGMTPTDLAGFQERLKRRLVINAQGQVIGSGRANAVSGRVPNKS